MSAQQNKQIHWWQAPAQAINQVTQQVAQQRQQVLTKPAGSLGELEAIAIQFAGLFGEEKPLLQHPSITVFAADHGIAAQGVSAFPQEVTAQMVSNFATGGAAICVLAKQLNAYLEVVDVGVMGPASEYIQVVNQKIAAGTQSFLNGAAMTAAQLDAALAAGEQAATRAKQRGSNVFIGGEMGIGNTSSAAALTCALLDQTASAIVGPGTGLNKEGVRHKTEIVQAALQFHQASIKQADAYTVLQILGGFEIAALCGAYISCAQQGIAILVDGFITTVAALFAVHLNPSARAWMVFGHQSAEPAHQYTLAALNAQPLLTLKMRLGEASGAATALAVVQLALALHNQMASFAEAGVSANL